MLRLYCPNAGLPSRLTVIRKRIQGGHGLPELPGRGCGTMNLATAIPMRLCSNDISCILISGQCASRSSSTICRAHRPTVSSTTGSGASWTGRSGPRCRRISLSGDGAGLVPAGRLADRQFLSSRGPGTCARAPTVRATLPGPQYRRTGCCLASGNAKSAQASPVRGSICRTGGLEIRK